MSTTAMKRPRAQALADAEALRELFRDCYSRWEIAGSVRRGKAEVGDVEHVVIPCITMVDEIPDGEMFPRRITANLLWHRAEQLLAAGTISKHVYGTTPHPALLTGPADEQEFGDYHDEVCGAIARKEIPAARPLHRWGNKYRGISFRGFAHEIFLSTSDNWGCVLAIRTGPGDFSKRLVTRFLTGKMYRQQDGMLVHVASGTVVPVRDEETYFKLAGLPFVAPGERR